jgi:hypothetical protein
MTMVRLATGLIVIAALSLSGCSEVRRALGYDKSPPDEFAVVARAPLAQPPDFTLRPPMPGATRPQEGTVRDQAKSALIPGRTGVVLGGFTGESQGERVILNKAGAEKADPDIRRKVDEETTALILADDSFTDKILFWQDKPVPGEALDPYKEAKRLQQGAAAAPSSGTSAPKIIRHDKGWFGEIF